MNFYLKLSSVTQRVAYLISHHLEKVISSYFNIQHQTTNSTWPGVTGWNQCALLLEKRVRHFPLDFSFNILTQYVSYPRDCFLTGIRKKRLNFAFLRRAHHLKFWFNFIDSRKYWRKNTLRGQWESLDFTIFPKRACLKLFGSCVTNSWNIKISRTCWIYNLCGSIWIYKNQISGIDPRYGSIKIYADLCGSI